MARARGQAGPPFPQPLEPLAFILQGTWRGIRGQPQVLSLRSSLERGTRQGVAGPSEGARGLWRTRQGLCAWLWA